MKETLRRKFSAEPEKYYQVELFTREGFQRRQCTSCGRYFWTLDSARRICPDQPCQFYEFLGDPPTSRRLDYVEAWRQIEAFFVKHGHASVKRYPVVCRWRPDLYFTVASIVDFQRVEGGKVVFELPYNPLIVPQICLRFNDIPSVGVTGRHLTSFCMIGQHSVADEKGYWKDRCIELDYELLKGPFEIGPEEIVFVEDVWLGYGAFGYSLEYFVRGLELGNAVFTAFEGTPERYSEMKEKVIDMGAGLERFAWITQGTPTSYDCIFGPVMKRLMDRCGVEYDLDFYLKYARQAGTMNFDEASDVRAAKRTLAGRLSVSLEELERRTSALEALYAVADHTRSLVFAISDGGLPSNVGGGYNLRVILRRALSLMDRFRWKISLKEIAEWHIDYLKAIYPELDEHRDEVAEILDVEAERYEKAKERTSRLISSIAKSGKALTEDDLVTLYDSEGVTPEFLREQGLQVDAPTDFYVKVTGRHMVQKEEVEKARFDVEGLQPTRLLFYDDQDMLEFDAEVVKVFHDRFVILDQTAFYATAGGQEHDEGFLDGFEVKDVVKYGKILVHEVKKGGLREGQRVHGRVDRVRREALMKHHTATHIVNGAARHVLGSWVWQHSAYKSMDSSRLDITHYAHLSREELLKIERLANDVVRMNIPVVVEVLARGEAEKKYGFRLYQGGVVPSRDIRVVKIGDFDVEACGGTHCSRTGDIGFIKIIKSERVQDGVERIEFVAGEPAVKLAEKQEGFLIDISRGLGVPQDKVVEAVDKLKIQFEELRKSQKALVARFSSIFAEEASRLSIDIEGLKIFVQAEEGLDEDFHIAVGEKAISLKPSMIYCAFVLKEGRVRLLVFCGSDAQRRGVKADWLVKQVAKVLGGSGGGDARFGQGGGGLIEKVDEARDAVARLVELGSQSRQE